MLVIGLGHLTIFTFILISRFPFLLILFTRCVYDAAMMLFLRQRITPLRAMMKTFKSLLLLYILFSCFLSLFIFFFFLLLLLLAVAFSKISCDL